MEFRFGVSDILREPVVEINNSLLPPGFAGDRRAMWDAITRTTEIVNAMGEASAKAQGLTKPITTAERLRNSEQQKLYLLVDREAKNGKGVVTGMLKTGYKGLYIFDRDGHHYQVTPPCVLDFYVHESRQRSGLGKRLFEHMLQGEKIEPVKIAIDRPSDKFLGFLNKHYKLNQPIKQMNNFVVFEGFFPDSQNKDKDAEDNKSGTPVRGGATSAKTNGLQNFPSPLGRYGAPRPPCSMGQIIHNQSPTVPQVQESASSPGRLNQAQPNHTSPIPRQVHSSYETNVNSGGGVPNNMQMGDFKRQMEYAHGDKTAAMQQNYQQTPQNMYNMQTQQQYPNPVYDTANYNNAQVLQSQQLLQNNIQHIQQMQLQQQQQQQGLQPQYALQQQMPTQQYLQPNQQYLQQPMPNQQYVQQMATNQQYPQQQVATNPQYPQPNQLYPQQQMTADQLHPQQQMTNPQLTDQQYPQQQMINPQLTDQQYPQQQMMNPLLTDQQYPQQQIINPQLTDQQYLQQQMINPQLTNQQYSQQPMINPQLTNQQYSQQPMVNPQLTSQQYSQQAMINPQLTSQQYSQQQMMQQRPQEQSTNQQQSAPQPLTRFNHGNGLQAQSRVQISEQRQATTAQNTLPQYVQSATAQPQLAYQQQLQPQVTYSAPQMQSRPAEQLSPESELQLQSISQQQLRLPQQQLFPPQQQLQPQSIPQQQLQQMPMAQQYYAPQQSAMQPQMATTAAATASNMQPTAVAQGMQQSPVAAQGATYSPNQQSTNYTPYNQSEKVLINPQSQMPAAVAQSEQQNTQADIPQTQNTQQWQTSAPPQLQTTAQPVHNTQNPQQESQKYNTQNYTYATSQPQMGDTIQNVQAASEQKQQYYDSSANETQPSGVQNLEAEGVAKKPSASGDRNMSQYESTYELEYPPRTPGIEPESKSQAEEQAHPSPKLERPRSLSIQISVEEPNKEEAAVPPENVEGEVQEEADKKDEKKEEDVDIEIKMGNLDVKLVEKTPDGVDGASVGRKTPHLTEQGFFDLKFYHNKLW